MRVIAGVHDGTTAAGANAHVALAASLAQVDVLVVEVGNNADGGDAVNGDVAHLAGRQANQCITVLLSHQLSHNTSGTDQLAALARVELDVVDHGTDGDVLKRQSVARLDIGGGASHNLIANLQAVRSQNVALGAVFVLNESDESGAVRVILKGLDRCGNAELVALEIDHAVLGAVAAAVMANGDLAGVVAAGMLLVGLQQAALGCNLAQHAVVSNSHAAAARGSRLVLFDSHCGTPF